MARVVAPPKCKHGNRWYCGLCEAEKAPKCKHGNPWACGFCMAEKDEEKSAAQPQGGNEGGRG